jgi:hypothetical protein
VASKEGQKWYVRKASSVRACACVTWHESMRHGKPRKRGSILLRMHPHSHRNARLRLCGHPQHLLSSTHQSREEDLECRTLCTPPTSASLSFPADHIRSTPPSNRDPLASDISIAREQPRTAANEPHNTSKNYQPRTTPRGGDCEKACTATECLTRFTFMVGKSRYLLQSSSSTCAVHGSACRSACNLLFTTRNSGAVYTFRIWYPFRIQKCRIPQSLSWWGSR